MKKLIFSIVLLVGMGMAYSSAEAYTRVGGYYRKTTGAYVAPHYRTNRDSSLYNNFSSRGNYNPYTGSRGYKSTYRTSYRSSYYR